MRRGGLIGAVCASLAVAACASTPLATRPSGAPAPVRRPSPSPFPAEPAPPPPVERTRPLTALHGWDAEDHAAALAAFRETCGVAKDADMAAACRGARAIGPLDDEKARRWFEANFRVEALPGDGVLTAYFAPEYPARHKRDDEFSMPVRPRPDDLKSVDAGMFDPALAGRPGAARDPGDGALEPYPDRAEIEAEPAARPPFGKPLAWMRPEDLFFLQVQGSGVLTFEGGERKKVLYAANNGRPFLGVANVMRDRGLLAADDTSAESIRAWLAAHRGPSANEIMRLNPRYAFFSLAPDDGRPPAGAAGIALPPGRALAIDAGYHAMGELFWIDGEAPILKGAFPAYRRVAMALDTGGAIKGDIRADLYLGQGSAAGAEAGRVRHTLRLYRLVPRPAPMKRPLKPEERHIWGMVASTVHPLPGRATPKEAPGDALPAPTTREHAARAAAEGSPAAPPLKPRANLDGIEPNRRHRIAKARDPIGARLDLHGLTQDRARATLERFLARAWDEGFRAVLVITGKGVQGDGILKRAAPEWLAAPHLAHIVAGISDAARHHGGEGALYVALKRKARG